jgi:hypothetical protein
MVKVVVTNHRQPYRVIFRCCHDETSPEVEGHVALHNAITLATNTFLSSGIWMMHFESEVSAARAVLLDSAMSVTGLRKPPTVLKSVAALRSYASMTKGGRVLVGSKAYWPPIDASDYSKVRLYFDFTGMYPSIMKKYPLPHLEHDDTLIADFSTDLIAGCKFIHDHDVYGSMACRVVVSGSFHPSLHPGLREFPPLVNRMRVPLSAYSDFQIERLNLKPTVGDELRNVCHLLPIEKCTMFLLEAKELQTLGFTFEFVGEVRGCPASMWAKPFAESIEFRRRTDGDAAASTYWKRVINSVIGAMNMNVRNYTNLHGVRSDSIDVTTLKPLETVDAPGKRSKRKYDSGWADKPEFTGRVYQCGVGTFIETSVAPKQHAQSTGFALAIQAYARVRHLQLWYGSDEAVGLSSFGDCVRIIYGNTDSLFVEIDISKDLDRMAKYDGDARVAVIKECFHWFDLSNISPASSLFAKLDGWIQRHSMDNCKRWGCVKEESGWVGYGAAVVNGPNRMGTRVLVTEDTPAELKKAPDVLKSLRKTAPSSTFSQYAASWLGTDEERMSSRWGNKACVVFADGTHVPFGYCVVTGS